LPTPPASTWALHPARHPAMKEEQLVGRFGQCNPLGCSTLRCHFHSHAAIPPLECLATGYACPPRYQTLFGDGLPSKLRFVPVIWDAVAGRGRGCKRLFGLLSDRPKAFIWPNGHLAKDWP
jgi:hypothetical protein